MSCTEVKPILEYMEAEITEFCNLNCKGCADFSNLATQKSFYSVWEYEKDLQRLAELFSDVTKIRLMGGEPLLNPDLPEYIKITKRIFPNTDLRIVTNGLLISKLTPDTLTTVKEYDCKLDISNYPPTRKQFPAIRKVLKAYGIAYGLSFPMNLFFKNILEHPTDNPTPAFDNCIFTHCHMMGHGKLSPCSYAHCIGRFNKAYGTDYPETDTVDLYSDITGEEILKSFSRPHEFCKCCGRGIIPFVWQGGVTASRAKSEDWLIKDTFVNKSIAPKMQSVLKPSAECLRALIQRK